MSLLEALNAIHPGRFGSPGNYQFYRHEILSHDPTTDGKTYSHSESELSHKELSEWGKTATPTHTPDDGRKVTGALKFLSINQKDHSKEENATEEQHEAVGKLLNETFAAFRVNLSERAGLMYNLIGWRRLQSAAFIDSADQDSFTTRYHLEWTNWRMIWSHTPSTPTSPRITHCIFSYSRESEMADHMPEFLRKLAYYGTNPMFPALISLINILTRMVKTVSNSEDELGEVSEGIGFQAWEDEYATDMPTLPNYVALSRQASAVASENAHHQFRLRLVHNLMSTVIEECDRFKQRALRMNESANDLIAYDAMRDAMGHLTITTDELAMFSNALQQLASIQITVIFNLIAQRDQSLNIDVARDSRTLAVESKRDSSSMKTIAAVTMFFLPGTFVASLFAMNLFDWDAAHWSEVANGRFWVYWVVTVPLTGIVMGVWLVWYYMKAKREHQEDLNAGLGKEETKKEDEEKEGEGEGGEEEEKTPSSANASSVHSGAREGSVRSRKSGGSWRGEPKGGPSRAATGLSAAKVPLSGTSSRRESLLSHRGTGLSAGQGSNPSRKGTGLSRRGTGMSTQRMDEEEEEIAQGGSPLQGSFAAFARRKAGLRGRMAEYRTQMEGLGLGLGGGLLGGGERRARGGVEGGGIV
ncbi:MAG: hypothetical protein Q9227_003782 [Pyrenula ochraceoflavens]